MSTQFTIHEDETATAPRVPSPIDYDSKQGTPAHEVVPLVSSKLGNGQRPVSRMGSSKLKLDIGKNQTEEDNENSVMGPMPRKLKIDTGKNQTEEDNEASMEALIARLNEQKALLAGQKNALASNVDSTDASTLLTPATDTFSSATPPTDTSDEDKMPAVEVDRLKRELEDAKSRLARQEKELTQTRAMQSTFDHLKPGATAAPKLEQHRDRVIGNYDHFGGHRPGVVALPQDDAKSDVSDFSHAGSMVRNQNPWINASGGMNANLANSANTWGQGPGRGYMNRPMAPNLPPIMVPQAQQPQMRAYSAQTSPTSNSGGRFMTDYGALNSAPQGSRRSTTGSHRNGGQFPNRTNTWDGFSNNGDVSQIVGINAQYPPMGMFQAPVSYQPRPIGTPLSPTAVEFAGANQSGPWNTTPASPGQTYISPMEPLNYRRLLDRSVTCNWKYIVDKIVCNNDQQASIFLQQKLKVGTVEQKYEIVEAIVAQAFPLMINRFGNFLVQRCFEHGTPEQVIAIANAIRGNTLSLSMDAFGCHVVQKAFDAVPEEYKAIMVHELLRRIPETVIHRYACHVWQKLFELRWSDSPPQIMKYVNEALCGMWHEVALGETGSLVVQNIFENCLEEDKRPCINEVLNSIDIVAHGQFGNWCIQHICEHGAPADRSKAVDHVLHFATEYSMDQFASKVVEKCLKIGGADFLERYLNRVCEGRPDRPRIPLIDISSDQYGNYLIQYILTHANAQHREIVASHIRKHMVSLRGSKFGSRVGMLCSNPAYATRPGPGAGPSTSRFNSNGSSGRFAGQFR